MAQVKVYISHFRSLLLTMTQNVPPSVSHVTSCRVLIPIVICTQVLNTSVLDPKDSASIKKKDSAPKKTAQQRVPSSVFMFADYVKNKKISSYVSQFRIMEVIIVIHRTMNNEHRKCMVWRASME